MSTFGSAQTIAGGLTSSGLLTASNGFTLSSGIITLPAGSVSAPSLTFASNLTTGIYLPGSAQIAITTGSTQRLVVSTSNIATSQATLQLGNGAGVSKHLMMLGADTLANTNDNYIYSRWTDPDTRVQIGFEWNYISRPAEVVNPVSNTGRYSTVVFVKNNQIGEDINDAGKVDLITFTDQGEILTQLGTATNASHSFAGDANTGMFSSAADTINFTTGGTSRIQLTTTGLSSTLPLTVSATTNQFVLGTTNTTTITSPAPVASRTYTIPDAGGAANFIMSTFGSAQTIAGGLTSSGLLTASNGFTLSGGDISSTSQSSVMLVSGASASLANATTYILGGSGANGTTVLNVFNSPTTQGTGLTWSSSTGTLTINTSGYYLISIQISFNGLGTNVTNRYVEIYVLDVTNNIRYAHHLAPNSAAFPQQRFSPSAIIRATAANTYQLKIAQNTNATATLNQDAIFPNLFSVVRLF
jgi:hypothetical protein